MSTVRETLTVVYRAFDLLESKGFEGDAVIPGYRLSSGFQTGITLWDKESARPLALVALIDTDDKKEMRKTALSYSTEIAKLRLDIPAYLFYLVDGADSYPQIFNLEKGEWTKSCPENFPDFKDLKNKKYNALPEQTKTIWPVLLLIAKWVVGVGTALLISWLVYKFGWN